MPTWKRSSSPALGALLCGAALAACGGGGTSSSTPATVAATPTPSATSSVGNAAIRADVQTALTVAQTSNTNPGGSQVLAVTRVASGIAREAAQTRRTSALSCNPSPTTGGAYGFSAASDGSGNTVTTYAIYYDAGCTQKELIEVVTAASIANQTAAVTTYDKSGNVTGTAALRILLTSNSSGSTQTITATAANATGIGIGQLGTTCVVLAGTTATTCGFAAISTVGSTPVGIAMTFSANFTGTSSGGNVLGSYSGTIAATGYSGNGMAIAQGNVPAWSVTGGTPIASLTGNATQTYNGSILTAGNLQLSDTTNRTSVAGTFSGPGGTITVSQNGATLATVTLDANGTGTVRYADGTSQNIAGWAITG